MTYKFSQRSLDRMNGVHPDLVAVMKRAIQITPVDFAVLEGLRSITRQKQLVASGASKTMNSRHLTGHAIDIAPLVGGQVTWDWPVYHRLAPAVKQAAQELGVPIEWGGDWTTFKDGPHWQLPWADYGKTDMTPHHTATGTAEALDPITHDKMPSQGAWASIIAALMALFGGKK